MSDNIEGSGADGLDDGDAYVEQGYATDPAWDEAVANALQGRVDEVAQQAVAQQLAPLTQQAHAQELAQLVADHPELGDDPTAQQAMNMAQWQAARMGLPPHAAEHPGFIRMAYEAALNAPVDPPTPDELGDLIVNPGGGRGASALPFKA
jgi:hypothetical protein